MTLPDHLFISDDGALYDTRLPEWSARPPLRAVYGRSVTCIANAADVKSCLRAGPYAWPGGYPLYFVTRDGGALSFDAVQDNLALVLADMRDGSGDWAVTAVDINYEDVELACDHTGEHIPSAYGDDGDDA